MAARTLRTLAVAISFAIPIVLPIALPVALSISLPVAMAPLAFVDARCRIVRTLRDRVLDSDAPVIDFDPIAVVAGAHCVLQERVVNEAESTRSASLRRKMRSLIEIEIDAQPVSTHMRVEYNIYPLDIAVT